MAAKKYSNVYPINAKKTLSFDSMHKFNEWVAKKSLTSLLKPFFDFKFFKPQTPSPSPELTSQKMMQQKEQQEKQFLLNIGCQNCGESDHNSMSCPKPATAPKR